MCGEHKAYLGSPPGRLLIIFFLRVVTMVASVSGMNRLKPLIKEEGSTSEAMVDCVPSKYWWPHSSACISP